VTIEQQIRDAFADLDELLLEGADIDTAVSEAARAHGLRPDVLMHRAKSQFGDFEVHRASLKRAAEWRAQQRGEKRAFAIQEKYVREEAAHAAESTYYACCLNEPEHAGTPKWPYCLERLSERLEVSDHRLREAARDELVATLTRLDSKHGTHTAHQRDLWNA
jgi:hypothetical protein